MNIAFYIGLLVLSAKPYPPRPSIDVGVEDA